jgi:hypothetical protein
LRPVFQNGPTSKAQGSGAQGAYRGAYQAGLADGFTEQLVANTDLEVVDSGAAYLSGKYRQRLMPVNSTVTLTPDLGLLIPARICEQLERGTGLSFNLSRALPILAEFGDEKCGHNLQAAQMALASLRGGYPIHTNWVQKSSGRPYARQPPIINLPSRMRSALEPVDGGISCEIDFQNFEPRILSVRFAPPERRQVHRRIQSRRDPQPRLIFPRQRCL